jgi:adenylate kinase
MRLILIGPPGSGKGTQAKLLGERLYLAHIATGDILREAIRLGTIAGKKAEPFVKAGKLVPDDLVNELVADRFRRDDRPERFVMDGYPRTLAQAASFDQVLRQQFLNLSAVIVLLVRDEEILRRLGGRWICPKPDCQATYHVTANPPRVPGICDRCGSKLVQRDDDKEETVRRRLEVYRANTVDLIPHYQRQSLVREVPGEGEIDRIYNEIIKVLPKEDGSCSSGSVTDRRS